jgi:hypothetical protein
MIGPLFTAIWNAFDGDSDLSTALVGGLWRSKAPADYTTFPYAVMFLVSAPPRETFTNTVEEVLIQFNIFDSVDGGDNDDTRINDVYAKLTALYDNNLALSITGYEYISMLRQNTFNDDEDDDIWQTSVEYEVRFRK